MRIIPALQQIFTNDGKPLISGWLLFLESGTVSTEKATYSDSAETIPNDNPLQLDAYGRCPDVFGSGAYKVVLYSNDPVSGLPSVQIAEKDPVGDLSPFSPFNAWNEYSIYSETEIVQGSDENYYSSLTDLNQGNDPISEPAHWQKIEFVYFYNAYRTYSQYDTVRLADGRTFISLVDANLNNNPPDSPSQWAAIDSDNWKIGTTETITFNPDGSISSASVSGAATFQTQTVEFSTDVSGNEVITVTTVRAGRTIKEETTFNADGTVTVVVTDLT